MILGGETEREPVSGELQEVTTTVESKVETSWGCSDCGYIDTVLLAYWQNMGEASKILYIDTIRRRHDKACPAKQQPISPDSMEGRILAVLLGPLKTSREPGLEHIAVRLGLTLKTQEEKNEYKDAINTLIDRGYVVRGTQRKPPGIVLSENVPNLLKQVSNQKG